MKTATAIVTIIFTPITIFYLLSNKGNDQLSAILLLAIPILFTEAIASLTAKKK